MLDIDGFSYRLAQLKPTKNLVVAYSGGLDSTVLLELLKEGGYASDHKILVAHINHGVSPNAELWQSHASLVAQQMGFEFVAIKLPKVNTKKKGLEQALREARISVWRDLVPLGGTLLTGHHANDQLETILMRLGRGSGLHGLSAIKPREDFGTFIIVRPLLEYTRTMLQEFGASRNLAYVEDESNQDARFTRNLLRKEVTPGLQKAFPAFFGNLNRSLSLVREANQFIANITQLGLKECQVAHNKLAIKQLLLKDHYLQNEIMRLIIMTNYGKAPSKAAMERIHREVIHARPDRRPCLNLLSCIVYREKGHLVFAEKSEHR